MFGVGIRSLGALVVRIPNARRFPREGTVGVNFSERFGVPHPLSQSDFGRLWMLGNAESVGFEYAEQTSYNGEYEELR